MAGLSATYIDATCFLLTGDVTATFVTGRRVKANCGVDGYKFGTIEFSAYDGTNTTICMTAASDDLTSNLIEVWYGIVSEGATGSVPIHTHDGSEGSGGVVDCCRNDELAAVSARRTTDFSIPTTYGTKITLDTTDVENEPTTVEHDNIVTSKIVFKEAGLYLVGYLLSGIEFSADQSTETHVQTRILLNNSIVIPDGEVHSGNYYSATNDVSEDLAIEQSFLYEFEAGDYIEIQALSNPLRGGITNYTATVTEATTLWAVKQEGSRGAQGPTGSGSNVNVYDGGVLVTGGPFSALNFLGADAVDSPTITGGVDISLGLTTAAVQAYYSGAPITFTTAEGYKTFTFDTTQVQTDENRAYHDSTAQPTRIYVLEDGVWHVGFFTEGDPGGDTACNFRLLVNGVAQTSVQTYMDSAGVSDTFHNDYLLTLSAGDYIEVQADPVGQNIDMHNSTFYCYRVTSGQDGADGEQGPQGIQGPPGTGNGNSIGVQQDGVFIDNSPVEILNFVGSDVAADGTRTAIITAIGSIIQVDRVAITGTVTTTAVIAEGSTPTSASGTAFGSNSITLQKSDSTVRVQIVIPCATDNDAGTPTALIHRGTTVLAVASMSLKKDYGGALIFDFYDTPGSVGPHTYSIRVGVIGNTGYFNRTKNQATPHGGNFAKNCWLTLTEIAA